MFQDMGAEVKEQLAELILNIIGSPKIEFKWSCLVTSGFCLLTHLAGFCETFVWDPEGCIRSQQTKALVKCYPLCLYSTATTGISI